MHEVILEIMVSEGCLKIIIDRRVVHKKKYQSSETAQLIYTSEGCPQTNKTIILIRGLGECERESVRTRDLSWSCRHSSRIMHLLECMFILEHYICT